MRVAVATVLLAGLAAVGNGAFCNMKSNQTGPMNTIPVDTSAPVFVKAVPNGELYTVGTSADDQIYLLHLYGNTGYEWGYAAGQLLKEEMNATLTGAYNYFVDQIIAVVNGTSNKYDIPPKLVELIVEMGLDAVLDLQNDLAQQFVDPAVYDEMRGMAAATGVDEQVIKRIHMIGEVTRGSCSFYGAFRTMTAGGKTLQLRALDWDMGAGLQNHPAVTIYHPGAGAGLGHAFANVGWTGWIGTLTGMSSAQVGISEIGVSYPNYPPYFGDEEYEGIPFIFLERQIVQRATGLDDAISMIAGANRTCRLILGVADGNARNATECQYSHSIARFFTSETLEPLAWWHPRIKDVVYNAMDWECPYYQHIMARQLTAMHGRLTPELSISNVTAVVQTGNLHAAVYDLTDMHLFVANGKGAQDASGAKEAYARQWLKIDAGAAFAKKYGEGR